MKSKSNPIEPDLESNEWFAIGELARRTGLSVLRIRAWEQRYGVPVATRMPSGHRRYSLHESLRLELIAQALQLGHRIGSLCRLDWQSLRGLINAGQEHCESLQWNENQNRWIELIRQTREKDIFQLFEKAWKQDDWQIFVEQTVLPWIELVGDAWKQGQLSVAEEHYATGILQGFLAEKWRSIHRKSQGPVWVLSLLGGDLHELGLHLCALVIAQSGGKIIWLGAHTPMASIVGSVRGWKAQRIAISVSCTVPWQDAKAQLEFIRSNLPAEVLLYAGGKGYLQELDGFFSFASLRKFAESLRID